MNATTKSILPFISLLIIATMALTPLIVAQDFDGGDLGGDFDGGSLTGFDGSGLDGGFDGSGLDGGFEGSGLGGGFDDGSTGAFPGGDTTAFPDDTPTGFPDDTPTWFPGDGPAFPDPNDVPPDDVPPFPEGDPGDIPPGPTWSTLADKTIYQASPDFTVIYSQLATLCTDTKATTVSIVSTHSHYHLGFAGYDLVITDLDPSYTGTEHVAVNCNGAIQGFNLHVIPFASTSKPDIDSTGDGFSIFIGQILIHDAYESVAGDLVPVTLSIRNNGHRRQEHVKVAIMIPELGIRVTDGPFDLAVNHKRTQTFYMELPDDVKPGTYYARITITSDDTQRIKHRDIDVIA